VNSRRLSVVLFIFAGAVLVFTFFVQRQKASRNVGREGPAASQPAEPANGPAGEPASRAALSTTRAARAIDPQPEETSATQPTSGKVGGLRLFAARGDERSARIGSLRPDSGYLFEVELSSRAAGIETVKLANHFATVADKRRYRKDADTYPQALLDDPERYKGHYRVLEAGRLQDGSTYLPMATGVVDIQIEGYPESLSVNLSRLQWHLRERPETAPEDGQAVSFDVIIQYGPSADQARPLLGIVKTYVVRKQDYSIDMVLRLTNLSDRAVTVSVDQAGPGGLPREGVRRDMRQIAYAYQRAKDQQVQCQLKPANKIAEIPLGRKHVLGTSDSATPMLWVGQGNKFFAAMMYLRPKVQGRLDAPGYAAKFYIVPFTRAEVGLDFRTGVQVRDQIIRPGVAKEISFDIFAGPKRRGIFADEKDRYFKALYKDLKYIGTIDFGGCFCTFSWLTLAMMALLDAFSKVAFGNYGVAIIILVLLVRLILHPLTKKSQVSMMRVQKLAPEIQKIKEKYANDKSAQNKEMMEVYKKQGSAPLMGCLPMFLQMPIWIALYTGLNAAVELRHASFLPFWITDLAAPDALFTWSNPLPLIGASFNLLPVLLAIAMFVQQKFSPQSAQAAASPQAQQQQKMMKYLFPGMMVVFFYKAPSGLTLYIMASTFAGVLDQYFVRKYICQKEAAEAAAQTTVRVPGKAPRGNRPKKPKGPLWFKHG